MANVELGEWPEVHSIQNIYNLFKQCFGFETLSYIIYCHGRSNQNSCVISGSEAMGGDLVP